MTTTFKAGDRVKIEGVLEKRDSGNYPLKLTVSPNLILTLNTKGEYDEESGVILEMVEPAPEPLKVGDTRFTENNATKAVIIEIFEGRVFYRYKKHNYDHNWCGGSWSIEEFLARFPNKGD